MEKKHETSTSLKLGMRMHTDCMLTAQMHACSMLSQGLYAWTYLIHRTRLGGINATLVLKLMCRVWWYRPYLTRHPLG